jgi:hypothetical protein
MKMNRPFALLGAAVLIAPWAGAEESVLLGREGPSTSDAPAVAESAVAVVTTSRGVPLLAQAREAAPIPRPAAPSKSRPESGTIIRSTIAEVVPESSHIVVTTDTKPAHYRYTKSTHFMDEQGRLLSPDAVKSGTNATLHYTRTEGDLVLTKVIVNGAPRPLVGKHTQVLTEVQFER